MECDLDYSILTEDVTREIDLVMREYNVRREIEDEDVSEDEFSTEDDSDSETLNDNSDLEFDFAEADISERSKVEAFIREACGCTLAETGKPCSSTITKEEFIDCRNNCTELTPTEQILVTSRPLNVYKIVTFTNLTKKGEKGKKQSFENFMSSCFQQPPTVPAW